MCSSKCEPGSAADPHALTDGELLETIADKVAARNRLDAEITHLVRVADARGASEHDALKSMQSWLRGHARMKSSAASVLVRRGRALDLLPATAAAFTAGQIGVDHLTEITKITTPKHLDMAREQDVDLGVVDQAMATIAATHTFQKLTETVADYLAKLDPDGPEPDPTERRSMTITTHADGSVTIHVELDPVGGERVKAVLEPMAAASRCAGDTRSPAQTRGDALVQWADNTLANTAAAASGNVPVQRGRAPQIAALIDLKDLVDPHKGPAAAQMGFGATISAATARWLACDSSIARIIMGPDGRPIGHGRDHRLVPAPLRRLLDIRDRGCVFAGCDAPHWWCAAHHLLEWVFGGETELDNLALLCERHHAKVHSGFTIEPHPDGTWRTYRPGGSEILTGGSLYDLASGPPG